MFAAFYSSLAMLPAHERLRKLIKSINTGHRNATNPQTISRSVHNIVHMHQNSTTSNPSNPETTCQTPGRTSLNLRRMFAALYSSSAMLPAQGLLSQLRRLIKCITTGHRNA
jgi:hypothetical protein